MFVLVSKHTDEILLTSSDRNKLESYAECFKKILYEKNRLQNRRVYVYDLPEYIEIEENKKKLKIELDYHILKNDIEKIKLIDSLYAIENEKQKEIREKHTKRNEDEYEKFCSENNLPNAFKNYNCLYLKYEIFEVEEI